MRKHIAILAVLLAALLCGASLLPMGLPAEDTLITDWGTLSDGTVVTADNQKLTSRIYQLERGRIRDMYLESRLQQEVDSSIRLLTVEYDRVHYLRSYDDGSCRWELLELVEGVPVSRCTGTLPEGCTATGLSVNGDGSWLTALNGEGEILLYDCRPTGDQTPTAMLRSILPALGGMDTQWARFDGLRTEVWTVQGDHYNVLEDGSVEPLEGGTPEPLTLELDARGWFSCKAIALLTALGLWLALAILYIVIYNISRRARTVASRLTAIVGGCILAAGVAAGALALHYILDRAGVAAFWGSLWGMLPGVAAVTVLAAVLAWITVRFVTRSVGDMTRQMAQVSEGRFVPRDVDGAQDELCRMDRNLQEMCMSLSIRDYEIKSTIRSYSRFVPQELTRLLDRANLAEISVGDSQSLVENVGVFSVGNRDNVRAMLPDESFVKFINYSFNSLYHCVDESRGVLLSGGLQLSSMEAMFPQDPMDGIRAGLDFLGETGNRPLADCPAPRLFVLLHRASFLYGLAGQEERLFPYVSSSELDFLEDYTQQLYETGARIVVTEEYWKQLEGCSGRYIGFLSDGEKGTAYKLYEILDAYPEMERNLRIRCNDQFQEALNLYYHNDFYLARNMFSGLLRDCPGDGVARWYLFACEYYFNRAEETPANYSLFGVRG